MIAVEEEVQNLNKNGDAADATRPRPDCTGRQLRDYLKATGTSAERIVFLDELLLRKPDASGKFLLEQMIAAKLQTGTLNKAGRYVYGPSFSLAQAGAVASTEEVDKLRLQVANLEAHIRGIEGQSAVQGQELIALRTDKARLTEDLQTKTDAWDVANKEIVRLRELQRASGPTAEPTAPVPETPAPVPMPAPAPSSASPASPQQAPQVPQTHATAPPPRQSPKPQK